MLRGVARSALMLVSGVAAQDYPTRPIRLVVPFGTGGATDSSARAVSERLARALGQPVVVENRGGAGGDIGTQQVAQASPDGYTLLLGLDATLVVNPFTHAKIPFDTLRDLAPITKLGDVALMLAAHPSLPARTLSALLEYSKANPGKLSYSTGGTGSTTHVAGELLKQRTGLDMTHIPYKSGGLAVMDAVAGQVQLSYTAVAGASAQVRAGKLIGIGASTLRRVGSLPDVPTFIEQGLADFEAVSWVGILAPAKTPKPIIDRLHRELVAILKEPEVRERFAGLGIEPAGNTPTEFAAQIRADLVRWQVVVERDDTSPAAAKIAGSAVKYSYLHRFHDTQIIENCRRAEREGFDAVMIGVLQDPGLKEARSVVDIPVIGYGEVSMLTACMHGTKFAFIGINPEMDPLIRQIIRDQGLESRAAPTAYMACGYPDFYEAVNGNPERFLAAFKEAAQKAIRDHDVDVLLPGQTIIAELVWRHGLRTIDGALVLDPRLPMLRMAEMLIDMRRAGFPTSRRGFYWAKPPADLEQGVRDFYGMR